MYLCLYLFGLVICMERVAGGNLEWRTTWTLHLSEWHTSTRPQLANCPRVKTNSGRRVIPMNVASKACVCYWRQRTSGSVAISGRLRYLCSDTTIQSFAELRPFLRSHIMAATMCPAMLPSVAKRGNIVSRRVDTQTVSEDFQKHFMCPGHKISVGHKRFARGETSQYFGNMITSAIAAAMCPRFAGPYSKTWWIFSCHMRDFLQPARSKSMWLTAIIRCVVLGN